MYTHSTFLCKLRHIKSRIYQTCCVCPFVWDPRKKLYVSNQKLKTDFNRESFIIPLLTIFQAYQLLCFPLENKDKDKVCLWLEFLLNILITTNTYIYIWKLDEYLGYINGTILFGDGIARE